MAWTVHGDDRRRVVRRSVLVAALSTGAILLATIAATGVGAVAAFLGAVAALALLMSRSPNRAATIAACSLAVACAATATTTTGPDFGRGLLIAAPPVAIAVLIAALDGRRRWTIAVAWAGGIVAGPIRALFDDPFRDAGCAGCRHSAFALLANRPSATVLASIGAVLLAVAAAGALRRARRPLIPAAAGLLGIGLVPALGLAPSALGMLALLLAGLVAGLDMIAVVASRRLLAQLHQEVEDGADATGVLRRASGDPTLRITFGGAAQDGGGLPVRSPDGRTIAVVHTTAPAALAPLLEPLDPSLGVALAGERLDAGLETTVRELRRSRSRVVLRADEERRRLERDLHDGAQQHLLALGFDLRAALVVEQDPQRRGVLEGCMAEVSRALDDLRDIAHGVYPPLLAIAGLAPALRALGSRMPVAIDIGPLPGRLPQSVERLAYLIVSELAHGASDRVLVSGHVEAGVLRFSVIADGDDPGALLRERVAALDGTLDGTRLDGRRTGWELTVPCA